MCLQVWAVSGLVGVQRCAQGGITASMCMSGVAHGGRAGCGGSGLCMGRAASGGSGSVRCACVCATVPRVINFGYRKVEVITAW
jgi:hypothetical protein